MKKFKIIGGIIAALALLWLAGAWFLDSPTILIPHPELEGMGYPEGSQLLWRSEGNGKSRFGAWGVSAVPDIRTVKKPKIILWGDSYVQASQVDDDKKMAQQLTRLLAQHGETNSLAVGVGVAGQSVADYLLKIPVYEKQMPPVAAHVVVIGQIEDLFPDQSSAHFAKFVSTPELHIIPARLRSPSRLKWLTYEWGSRTYANGVLSVVRNCADGLDLQFKMGPIAPKTVHSDAAPSPGDMAAWFDFYVREFKSATDKPLILVYLPTLPRMEGNSWVFNDADDEAARSMERIFTQHGWTVIDMKERFEREFRQTGCLPRGFANTRPGSGHLNETGHRLIAEALKDCLLTEGYFDSVPTTDNR